MKSTKSDYILLGISIALTGFEFAFRASIFIQLGILVCITPLFIIRRKKITYKFFFIVIPFILALTFQALQFNSTYLGLANILAYCVKFLLCFFIFELVKERFHHTFVNIIYFFALISFIFFPTQFFPSLQESIKSTADSFIRPLGTENIPEGFRSTTLIFFTYQHSYGHGIEALELRNSGPFWEPGMFGVFLSLALVMNVYLNKAVLLSKKNIVFILAILTTLSTTAYLALFLVVLSKYIIVKDRVRLILYFPILILFVVITYNYVWELDFMRQKVETNIAVGNVDKRSRFGSITYHMEELKKSPFSGSALAVAEKEKNTDFVDRQVSPNGLSLIFFVFGIPVGIYYFIVFYKGINRWLIYNNIVDSKARIFIFIVFLLLSFSQDITLRISYIMVLFFGICLPKKKVKKITRFKLIDHELV